MAKILIFEGAGWDVAEHNGVGNCRIRTRIKNIDGVSIYLEMSGTKKRNRSIPSSSFSMLTLTIVMKKARTTKVSSADSNMEVMAVSNTRKKLF
ncbi:hypothetical protein PAV_141p01650 (plasmid) [Paenibacillus alvei DSM 29]|uniref:hypothetical protein n=1 Tax=Paenibacillus alvei TaxID=44250 RepID=UPI000287C4E4|nr:hypothetical protein [Paenibacillus alvei]EJW14059.1 hypothetical protein PAV_141p01650 [Paenibacillus alvei DSM 29]